jgi:hypothetical protein
VANPANNRSEYAPVQPIPALGVVNAIVCVNGKLNLNFDMRLLFGTSTPNKAESRSNPTYLVAPPNVELS